MTDRPLLFAVSLRILALTFCCIALSRQAHAQPVPAADVYAGSITAETLYGHAMFLADDQLEGRDTGERGQQLAALYIASQFARLGLKPGNQGSWYQNYYLSKSSVNDASIQIGKKTFNYREHFVTFGGHGVPATLPDQYVFAGYGLRRSGYDNLSALDLKGKVAVVLAGNPPGEKSAPLRREIQTWFGRAKDLRNAGAAAMMMVLPDSVFNMVSRFAQRSSLVVIDSTDAKGFPAYYLSESTGRALFAEAGTTPEALHNALANPLPPDIFSKKLKIAYSANVEQKNQTACNVLGLLEGSDLKDEVIVLSAHFDHVGVRNGKVYNGADDDASGTSSVMGAAEAFAKAAREGIRPRRSILFVLFSGEEKGLLGSEFYTNHPVFPLAQTVTNLNIDMVGRIDDKYAGKADSAQYVYVIGADKLSRELHELHESVNSKGPKLTLDYRYNSEDDPNRYYYRSDHYNFAKNDVPVIFYFNGTHPDYHQPGDDLEKLNTEKMARIARLAFLTAWELAWRPERPVLDATKGK